jgi:hypothetical protein
VRVLASFALSVLGLVLFTFLAGRISFASFALLTAAAAVVGLVSAAMAVSGLRSAWRRQRSAAARFPAVLIVSLALGYELVMLILLLNVLVYWQRFS